MYLHTQYQALYHNKKLFDILVYRVRHGNHSKYASPDSYSLTPTFTPRLRVYTSILLKRTMRSTAARSACMLLRFLPHRSNPSFDFLTQHSSCDYLKKNSQFFEKKFFFSWLLPFLNISLRFLCKFEEQLLKIPKEIGMNFPALK